MSNYAPLPVEFVRGEGAWLTDSKGQHYLDALSGIAVCGLGHAHPAVLAAISDQAQRLIHTSNLYHIPLQEQLAQRLTGLAAMERAFFANSGAEANEAAIKLARLFARQKNIAEPVIVVMQQGFHGRTLAALSATGNTKAQQGFEPLVAGFRHIPYNDLLALHALADQEPNIVALMVEPIQGEGGIVVPEAGYLGALRSFCDQHDCLLIVDEVQTGLCRTGRWFAFQHDALRPDILTLAKALGNGVPIGACLARGRAAALFQPGSHGSTFGGNPLAARAALAVLDVLEQEALAERAEALGRRLLRGLAKTFQGVSGVRTIRGRGLMIGIELTENCAALVERALQARLLINVTAGNVIRLLPPLIISDQEADEIVSRLGLVVKDYLTESKPAL